MLTTKGLVEVQWNWYHCRYCTEGFRSLDAMLGIDIVGHKVTPEMAVKIAFAGQMAPSFEAAELSFQYLAGLQISRTLIRQITAETGQKVYEQQMEEAKKRSPGWKKQSLRYCRVSGGPERCMY